MEAGGIIGELLSELHDFLAGGGVEHEAAFALGVLLRREAQAKVILAKTGEVVGIESEAGLLAGGHRPLK